MLNERIRKLRLERGWSQVELAKKLNVTKQSVSNWENDNIQPSIEMLIKLAKVFAVSTDYLLGLEDRRYLEVTGISDEEISHIQLVIRDLAGRER
ncbi:MAG: helix-turn-helix transcriptional regulator [Clostridia bacterium]|nr:helix-turn-helix transcriptional regulator [Clostridia bacterium]